MPFSFGNAALVAFERETGISLIGGNLNLNYEATLQLAYVAARDGARKERKDFGLTFEDFCDALDEDRNALTKIMDAFSNSMPQEDQQNGEKKRSKAAR